MGKFENILVSVIMPSYNTEKFILKSIESVLKQTHGNLELIIIDDCSSDNSRSVIKNIKDNRIKLILNKNNSGAAISRNTGIKLAKGKYIAFLDSDDLWNEKKIEKQLSFMEDNNYYFTYSKYSAIDEDDNLKNIIYTGPKKISKKGYYLYNWAGCLTVMFNCEKIGKIQINDIKKRNDYAIWLKISKNYKCYLLNENLAMYRHRDGSLSRVKKTQLLKYHYYLFRDSEQMSVLSSMIFTLINILMMIYKKLFFEKKII